MDGLAALRASWQFAEADPATLERLAAAMMRREFSAGTLLYSAGDSPNSAYLVESGNVWLTLTRATGSTFFVVDIPPGEIVGHFGALLERPQVGSAVAHNDVVAWHIPQPQLRDAVRSDAGIAYPMLMRVLDYAVDRTVWAGQTQGQSTRGRIAWELLWLVKSRGTHVIELSHADLAMRVGATRESVTRTLTSFKRENLIATRRRSIIVLDVAGLERIAQGE
ncbi:MAG TPA: Crp/Fnr family transcriptional regulator [Actinomycetota bacterium]|nr:Crp/Fnr family transcriptional regulator [Actinomycetota bacterium]